MHYNVRDALSSQRYSSTHLLGNRARRAAVVRHSRHMRLYVQMCRRGFAEPLTALFVPACLCTSNPLSCSECFSRNVHMRCRPNSWFSLHGGLRSGLCVGRQCDPHLRRSSAVGWQGAVPSRMPRVSPASRGSRLSFLLAWPRPGVDMLLVVQAGLPCEWVDRADL